MELPVLSTVEVQGARVIVRAAPVSLVAELAEAGRGAAFPPIALRVIKRCCSLENGDSVPVDCLSMESAQRLVFVAVGGEGQGGPDFPSRPGLPDSGG